jgi:hypothetical protein
VGGSVVNRESVSDLITNIRSGEPSTTCGGVGQTSALRPRKRWPCHTAHNHKLLFDIYHVQIMDGNLIETIRNNIAAIGHFHVGDVPGRQEPCTGEIHYGNVFKAIAQTPFDGFVDMEYRPSKDAMQPSVKSVPFTTPKPHETI